MSMASVASRAAVVAALQVAVGATDPLLRRLQATNSTDDQKAALEEEEEHAPDIASTNMYVVAILVTVAVVTGISVVIDRMRVKEVHGSGLWTASLKVMSYLLLIPGISHILYHYNVALSFFGQTWKIRGGTETMLQLIRDLHSNNCTFAAVIITFYAIFIPAAKVIMLAIGLCWQNSVSPTRVTWSRRCLIVVQKVSKWASPDMFAYILMMYLFREVNHPPSVLSDMTMDVGFTCFCVFCVGSTVSALGIRIPAKPVSDVTTPKTPARTYVAMAKRTAAAVVVLTVLFFVSLAFGIALASMSLKMDMDLFYSEQPSLKAFKAYIDGVHLDELVHAEVSIWNCVVSLARWLFSGELNSGVAFVMYVVFVLLLSACDMLAMSVAAIQLCQSTGAAAASKALAASRVLGRISMLDVSVVGVLVIVLAMQDLRKKGITVSLEIGIVPLSAAAICQYLAFFLVRRASLASLEIEIDSKIADAEKVGNAQA